MRDWGSYFKRYTFRQKITLILEQYFWPLFNIIPGYEGIILRHLFLKLVCRKVGKMGLIFRGVRISHACNMALGDSVDMNSGIYIDGRGGVDIGNFCFIGPDVKILTSNHRVDEISGPMMDYFSELKKVTIEDDTWLAAGAIITPGVTVRKGSVVASGAVLVTDTEPYSIYGGVPAKFIRWRKRGGKNNGK